MIKHERKIVRKVRMPYKPKLYKVGDKIKVENVKVELLWTFHGYMGTGEQVWYNEIDDYTFMGNVN